MKNVQYIQRLQYQKVFYLSFLSLSLFSCLCQFSSQRYLFKKIFFCLGAERPRNSCELVRKKKGTSTSSLSHSVSLVVDQCLYSHVCTFLSQSLSFSLWSSFSAAVDAFLVFLHFIKFWGLRGEKRRNHENELVVTTRTTNEPNFIK